MIIDENMKNIENKFEDSFSNPSQNFRIKTNPKVFKLLHDNLYSNKIESVIRELISNAYDSHVKNNTTNLSIDFSLINNLFIIRDHGVGMSYNQIMSNYSTYFDSDKTNSNEFVGAFGLGSKSPFCYTNEFYITSYYNNSKLQFVVFLDNDGYPKIRFLSSEKHNGENGFSVNFNIKPSDYDEFEENIKKYGKYLNITLNGNKFEKSFPPAFETENFQVFFTKKDQYGKNIVLLNSGFIEYNFNKYDLYNYSKINNNIKIFLKFNIGELELNASREDVIMNDNNKYIINNKFEECLKFLELKVQETINNSENLWQAVDTVKYYDNYFTSKNIHLYNNIVLKNNLQVTNSLNNVDKIYTKIENKVIEYKNKLENFYVNSDYQYIVDDSLVALSKFVAGSKKLIIIRFEKLEGESNKQFKNRINKENKKLELVNILQCSDKDVLYSSEIENLNQVFYKTAVNKSNFKLNGCNWDLYEKEIDSDVVYVKLNYGRPSLDITKDFVMKQKNLIKLGFKTEILYGIIKQNWNKIEDNWVEFDVYYENCLNSFIETNRTKLLNHFVCAKYYQNFNNNIFKNIIDNKSNIISQKFNDFVKKYYDMFSGYSSNYNSVIIRSKFMEKYELEYNELCNDVEIILNKYPLIFNIHNTDQYVEYIDMIDKND